MRLPEALPPLAGRTGAAVRAAFLALVAVTALMLATGSWMSGRDFFVTVPNNLQFGFMTGSGSPNFQDPDQVRIYAATSEAARRSGLRQDDVILSISGRPVPAAATELQVGDMMGTVRGNVATLVTRSSDGTVRTHRLPRQADAWSASIATTGLTGWQRSAFLFGADEARLLFLFAAALILYRRRPRDPVALIFATAFLLYCHRGSPGFWFWHSLGIEGVRPWLTLALYVLLAAGLNAFPDGRFGSRVARLTVAIGIPALVALLVVQRIASVLPAAAGSYGLIALLLVSAGGLVLRYRRLTAGPERQQIKWAVTGFAAFVALTAATMIPALLGFNLIRLGPAGFIGAIALQTVASLILPLGLLVSLLRYRLYDADAAITRSASWSMLSVAVVVVFAGAKQGLELVAENWFDGSATIASSGIAAALAAVMITPLHHRAMRWSEERFQKPLTKMRRSLPELVGDLRETANLGALGAAALERVETGVRASRAALIIEGQVVAARGAGGELPFSVPLRADEHGPEIGALKLGPRPDGSLYGKDEREALAEIAEPLARAVRVVRLREAAAAARAEEIASLEARLRAIEARLDPPAIAAE